MVEVEDTISSANEILTLKSNPFVVVGIPAYNEEKTIAQVVLDAQKFSDMVMVCDDGSDDHTGEIALRRQFSPAFADRFFIQPGNQ